MSVSYLTARKSDDAQNTRSRTGTLPDGYGRKEKRHFGYHGGLLLLALAVGVVIGAVFA